MSAADFDRGRKAEIERARTVRDELVAELEERVDTLETCLDRIISWSEAYPLDVFPEPDFKKVRAALEAAGLKIDHVSASNMRHVVVGVRKIAGLDL